jgi:hypothetical protein
MNNPNHNSHPLEKTPTRGKNLDMKRRRRRKKKKNEERKGREKKMG